MSDLKHSPLLADRILKVNHAGENGAVHIYAGQIHVARVYKRALAAELAEFKKHEERHRIIFASELDRRGLRKCRSYWLCAAGGYVLGVVTALLGEKAIASTTVAVERVVRRHLHQQLDRIGSGDAAATSAIMQIIDDERHHHDMSANRLGAPGLLDRVIDAVVSISTEGSYLDRNARMRTN